MRLLSSSSSCSSSNGLCCNTDYEAHQQSKNVNIPLPNLCGLLPSLNTLVALRPGLSSNPCRSNIKSDIIIPPRRANARESFLEAPSRKEQGEFFCHAVVDAVSDKRHTFSEKAHPQSGGLSRGFRSMGHA